MAMKTKSSSLKNYFLIVAIFITGLFCLAQQTTAQDVNSTKTNKPNVRIKVKKEYDDKGNITRFDSTYSYSWSGNGQIPADADSMLRRFNNNFFEGNKLNSMFNQMGISWPFEDDSLTNQPYTHFNRQFEEFFKSDPFPNDTSFENSPYDLLGGDFRKILKQQQQRMDQFFHQLYFDQDSLIISPNDTITRKEVHPKGKINPEKQNYIHSKKTDKTIRV